MEKSGLLTTSRMPFLQFTGLDVATKLALSIIAGVVIMMVGSGILAYRQLKTATAEEATHELGGIVKTLAPTIAIADHLAVIQAKSHDNVAFRRMRAQLKRAAEANGLREDQLYTFVPNRAGVLTFVTMLHDRPFVGQNYQPPDAIQALVRTALVTGEPGHSGVYADSHGTFVSAFAPIKDDRGGVVGLLWADRDITELISNVRKRVVGLLAVEAVVAGLLILLVLWQSRRLRKRLRTLLGGLSLLRDESNYVQLKVEGHDEFAQLAQTFNGLSEIVYERQELATFVPAHAREYVHERVARRLRRSIDEQHRISAVVMFTDIRGFTELAEKLVPEDVVQLANVALTQQIAAISATGGQVHKFLGDGLLAVFDGSRKVERALEAAAAIHANWDQGGLPAIGDRRLEVGIGLTFGEVVVGTIGSEAYQERAILGAQVNLAARLCAAAARGEVIMSGALFEQVRGRLDGAESRAVDLKGIADVAAYALSGDALQRVLDVKLQGQVPIFDDSRPDTIPAPASSAPALGEEVDPPPGARFTIP